MKVTIRSKNCEKYSQSTFHFTWYLYSYCLRHVGRCPLLCITLCAYKNMTANEEGTYYVMHVGFYSISVVNEQNHDAETQMERVCCMSGLVAWKWVLEIYTQIEM
jgi:hypothetical protein